MVKSNVAGAILVLVVLLAATFHYNKSQENAASLLQKNAETSENNSQQEIELFKKKQEKKFLKLQEENLKLQKLNGKLRKEKMDAEESNNLLKETNTKILAEVSQLKEKLAQKTNKKFKTKSPYKRDSEKEKKVIEGKKKWAKWQRDMIALKSIPKISTLTKEQNDFIEALNDEFKEFRVRMIRNEEELSPEQSKLAWTEQIESYRENIYSVLTPEQLTELDKITDEQIKLQTPKKE